MSNQTNEANAYAEIVSEENQAIRNLLYAAWMAGYNSRNKDFTRLRADKERLDFLDSQVWPVCKRSDPQPPIVQLVVKLHHNPNGKWVNCVQNARKTIDAASAALAQTEDKL